MTDDRASDAAEGGDSAELKRIAGYEITGFLGRGAMGVVYKARQLSLNREVALKVLHKRSVADPSYVARFLREARNAARLQHPNIVQAIDVGQDGNFYYFAMELVQGQNVGDILRLKGRLSVEEAMRIARQVASALDYAWTRAGMIHRDVKPTNILIDQYGAVKLVDMGLAKSSQDTLITTHGAVLGTLAYISPEQLEDSDLIDHRTDIYSLGCTLYHILTGRPPFQARTRVGVLTGHLAEPVPDPRALVSDIPEPLALYCIRMMAKRPDERPRTGAEIEIFMEDLLEDLGYELREHNTELLDNFKKLFSGAIEVSGRQAEFADESDLVATKTVQLAAGVDLMLVLIPSGTFLMGSPDNEEGRNEDEGPLHTVAMTQPFYMGVCLVTQRQYQAVVGANPSRFKGESNPVERVSWFDAVEFCQKAGAARGLRLALPTEAQWEYACRAGTTTRFGFGDDPQYTQLVDYAWYSDNSAFRTHTVGQKQPTSWQVFDMHGNVWEWCRDYYQEDYYGQCPPEDPAGPPTGAARVLRGGSCLYFAKFLRSANRSWAPPEEKSGNIGFRVVADAEEK